jgi:antitoxin VapB
MNGHLLFYTSAMALSIKSDEADRLARRGPRMSVRLRRLQSDVALLPVRDPRAPEEILGYDDHGLPT